MPWRRMGEWRYSSTFLDPGTRCKRVVIFRPVPLYPRGKGPRYPLDRRLGGAQRRSGRCGEEENLALPAIELGRPGRSPSLYRLSYPDSLYMIYILSPVSGDYYKTGYWIGNWIYWITHSYTQLQCIRSYSSLQFTITLAESSRCIFTRCLSSKSQDPFACNSSLKTAARPEYSLVTPGLVTANCQLTLMASLAITHWLTVPVAALLYSPWTDHKENTYCCIGCCCLGTDLVENAAFPLLRSRLGWDQIENMSLVCLATVVNKRFHCWPTACASQYYNIQNIGLVQNITHFVWYCYIYRKLFLLSVYPAVRNKMKRNGEIKALKLAIWGYHSSEFSRVNKLQCRAVDDIHVYCVK
jgi:hypothetical protein